MPDEEQLSGRCPRHLLRPHVLIEPTANEGKSEWGVISTSTNRPFGEKYGYHGETFEVERFPQGAADPVGLTPASNPYYHDLLRLSPHKIRW